jgi:transposase-like protein
MIKQNLIIYSNPILYDILKELEKEINYNVEQIFRDSELDNKELSKYLILSSKQGNKFLNEITLDFPLKISKLIEKVNIQFLKIKTKEKSSVPLGKYEIDLNSRMLNLNSNSISLTEKEINLLIFLSKSKDPVSINKLQEEVWSYTNDVETHTVETHIHRLRKKILNEFKRDDFILSDKRGYYLKI